MPALTPTTRGPIAFFGQFKTRRGWAALIALVNLVGIAYGFWYYRAQFAQTPWFLWPFVPDSPLAVLWAELALLAYWLKRPSSVLDSLAYIGNVQVGLWTVYVLVAYAPSFRTFDMGLNTVLLFGHLGMVLLALVFVQGLRERRAVSQRPILLAITLAAAYYAANDALDYFGPDYAGTGCGIRPYTVPCTEMEPALTLVTFGLTVIATVTLLAWTRPRRT